MGYVYFPVYELGMVVTGIAVLATMAGREVLIRLTPPGQRQWEGSWPIFVAPAIAVATSMIPLGRFASARYRINFFFDHPWLEVLMMVISGAAAISGFTLARRAGKPRSKIVLGSTGVLFSYAVLGLAILLFVVADMKSRGCEL